MARELQYMTSQWNTMLLKVLECLAPVIARVKTLVQDRNVLKIACGPYFWTCLMALSTKTIMATDYNESTLDMAQRKPLDWQKVPSRSLTHTTSLIFHKFRGLHGGRLVCMRAWISIWHILEKTSWETVCKSYCCFLLSDGSASFNAEYVRKPIHLPLIFVEDSINRT